MNENTGEIRHLTQEQAIELNKLDKKLFQKDGPWHDVSNLTENERLRLQGMNRAQRRRYFRDQRRAAKRRP